MEQIIYTSVAAPDLDAGEVFKILAEARERNRDRDITGMLVIVDGRFFQAIEGPEANIARLMTSLKADRRHESIRVLRRRPIAQRQFPDWSMKRFRVRDAVIARNFFQELMERNEDASKVLSEFKAFVDDQSGAAA